MNAQIKDSSSLLPIESINAVDVFTGAKLDELLHQIRAETMSIVPDVSTAIGRKEIASLAYKVARSKTAIDDAGKDLVAEWKQRAAVVDASRKKARDFLDGLKNEVRAPLDAWEAEESRKEQQAIEEARQRREAEEAAARAAEAERIAEIERREAAVREAEARIAAAARAEADRIAAAKAEAERAEREARIHAEAVERAEREAIEVAEREAREAEQARIDTERAEARRKEDAERAEATKKLRQEQEAAAEERARLDAEKKAAAKAAQAAEIANATLLSAAAEAVSLLQAEGYGDHLTTQKLAAAINREPSQQKAA